MKQIAASISTFWLRIAARGMRMLSSIILMLSDGLDVLADVVDHLFPDIGEPEEPDEDL